MELCGSRLAGQPVTLPVFTVEQPKYWQAQLHVHGSKILAGSAACACAWLVLTLCLVGACCWCLVVACREIWKHCTHPGTFRGLARATVQWVSGNGWTFSWPAHAVASSKATETPVEPEAATPERMDAW
jgi:hypothetical protein